MSTLVRITKIAWQFRTRLILAYLSFLAAVSVSLLIPQLFGEAIGLLVAIDDNGIALGSVSTRTLIYFAFGILGAILLRGLFDFARP